MKTSRLRLRDLWRQQLHWWSLSVLVGSLTLLASVLLLATSGWFISAAALAGVGALFNYMRPGALIRLFAIVRTAGRYGERLLSHAVVLQLLAVLRVQTFVRLSALRQLPWAGGERLQRLIADIDVLDQLPLRLVNPVLYAVVLVLLYLLTIWWLLPAALTGLSLLLLAFVGVLAISSRAPQREAAREIHQQGHRRAILCESLQVLTTLLASGHWQQRAADLWHSDEQINQLQRHQQHRQLWLQAVLQLLLLAGLVVLWQALPLTTTPTQQLDSISGLPSLTQISVPLWLALLLGWLGLTEILLPLVLWPASWGQVSAAQQRCDEIWLAAGVPTPPAPVASEAGSAAALSLQIDQLQFGFVQPLGLCHGRCRPGDVVLIKGKSGGGKSCLLQTLAGELPALAGELFCNGQPLSALTPAAQYSMLGYLPQRPYVFGLTIAAELRLAKSDASDDELLAMLALVELSDWLARQPAGLSTLLSAHGVGLSGGELKRFALARLLLQRPAVLLLDEPFAGLQQALAARLLCRLVQYQAQGILLLASHQQQQAAGFTQIWDLASEGLISRQCSGAVVDG